MLGAWKTKKSNEDIITNGGRVLGVTATDENLEKALATAYKKMEQITFDEMQFRKDIGLKSI